MDKFKKLVKKVIIVNKIFGISSHVGDDLIILCAGSPYLDENNILHGDKEIFDEKNGLYLGSTIRYEASALELESNKYDRYILVGGFIEINSIKHSKSEAMKEIILGYTHLTDEQKQSLNNKITLLVSEPNTYGNCVAVSEYYNQTHFPKTMTILTNEYHMDRSLFIFKEHFMNRYVNIIKEDNAENVLYFTDADCAHELNITEEQYHNALTERKNMEQNGIRELLDNTYKK